MESFLTLAKTRYSVRNYLPAPVEPEKLEYILECGRIAPSAANYQPWQIVVVSSDEVKAKLHDSYPRDWFREAPLILVFLGDHRQGWKRQDGKDHTDIDIAILVDHVTLAAAEQGLGTCWICNFDTVKCSNALDLPEYMEPIAILPLGYPAEPSDANARHLKRKRMEEIVVRK